MREDVFSLILTRTKVCMRVLIIDIKGKISPVLLIITVLFTYWVKLISEIILAEAVQP